MPKNPSKTYRFIRIRIIALVDIFDAFLMLILGEKSKSFTMKLLIKEAEYWQKRRNNEK